MNAALHETAALLETYINERLFDPHGLMYAYIDAQTGKPLPKDLVTPIKVPRRADINPWAYWTYEDTVDVMGKYVNALVWKYEVTGEQSAFDKAKSVWLGIKDVYYASQVFGIGSFLRPYGGFEEMVKWVEPLGTDQASPLLGGQYAWWKVADDMDRWEIADIAVKTLSWYEQQHFRYCYYRSFIHHWEVEWPHGYQHAGSYYLPGIAFAAKVTDEERWKKHLREKLKLFEDERYDVFTTFYWAHDLPMLAELLGDEFSRTFTRDVLDRGYRICQDKLAAFNEPGMVRRLCPESAQPGFKPHMKSGFNRATDGFGYAYFWCVHQGRERPRQEIMFLCGLAALGYPGAFEQAEELLGLFRRVPEDFTAFLMEDYDQLPEEVHLYARAAGNHLVEWVRNYWMLRRVEKGLFRSVW